MSTPRDTLVAAMVDAMNRYVNQVLIPANLIQKETWRRTDTGIDSDICRKKHAIANEIADKWENNFRTAIEERKR